jgi:2-phosphoglycerate kinase
MKNIIIIGASRAGKSELTKLLNKRLNNLMIIRADLLRLAFREAICKDTTIKTSSLKNNLDYRNYILSYYKYANMYDVEYIKVVDTVDFEPKDYKLFDNSIMICLGYPNLKEEEVLKNWHKFDTDLDWTKNKTDEELLKHANKHIKESLYLKEECNKYNIKFVDTSYNRDEKLNELVDYITDKIND